MVYYQKINIECNTYHQIVFEKKYTSWLNALHSRTRKAFLDSKFCKIKSKMSENRNTCGLLHLYVENLKLHWKS